MQKYCYKLNIYKGKGLVFFKISNKNNVLQRIELSKKIKQVHKVTLTFLFSTYLINRNLPLNYIKFEVHNFI